jgi:hypothetical protein
MRPHVLSMADTSACDDVLDPLRRACEVLVLPAEAAALRQHIADAQVYLASLQVQLDAQAIALRSGCARSRRPRPAWITSISTPRRDGTSPYFPCATTRKFLGQLTATAELAWAHATVGCAAPAVGGAGGPRRRLGARPLPRDNQLSGKTLGIIGYGRLGSIVAEYGKAFRMRVIATDITHRPPAQGVEMMPLDRLLRQADVVSLHVHLTDQTRGMLGREQFAIMKPGAVLINTSRGAIVDETVCWTP